MIRLIRTNGRPCGALGHMLFKGSRTQKEVREDQERVKVLRTRAASEPKARAV